MTHCVMKNLGTKVTITKATFLFLNPGRLWEGERKREEERDIEGKIKIWSSSLAKWDSVVFTHGTKRLTHTTVYCSREPGPPSPGERTLSFAGAFDCPWNNMVNAVCSGGERSRKAILPLTHSQNAQQSPKARKPHQLPEQRFAFFFFFLTHLIYLCTLYQQVGVVWFHLVRNHNSLFKSEMSLTLSPFHLFLPHPESNPK